MSNPLISRMATLDLDQHIKIHYQDHCPEQEQAVLLLHGLGANSESWQLQIPALISACFRVIAPDARGFGQSTFHGRGTSIRQMASDFARLVEHLKIDPPHVIGISMGGTHALQLALDYPQQVNKLVLANTFARLKPPDLRSWVYFGLRFILVHTMGVSRQAQLVARRLFPGPEQEVLRQELVRQIEQADPQAYRAVMRALARFNVENRLHEIRSPTLIITGERDSTIPPDRQIELVKGIPNAEHFVIPQVGHAVSVENPQVFNHRLLQFLKNGPSG